MRQSRSLGFAACAALLGLPLAGQNLQSRRTETLNLVYPSGGLEDLSFHLARCFENSMSFHRKLFDYRPSEPVSIRMQDWGDFGHGGTSALPWNYISLGVEPFVYTYDTMPTNERMNWIMHHELAHVVASDKAAGRDLAFRRFFRGKVEATKDNPLSMFYSYLSAPRWYAPRWYHEGIATFLETWMAGGAGRSLGGYDEMVFRTMVLEDAYFYDVIGLESEGTTVDFQTGQNSYLYGTRFVTYLGMRHGPEKVIAWFDRKEGSHPSFDDQFQTVFGTSLQSEWRTWIAWERQWQQGNLELIRKFPVTRDAPVTAAPLGNVSRSFYDPSRQCLYLGLNRPAHPAQIVSLDLASGRVKPLVEVFGPSFYMVTSLAYDGTAGRLYWTSNHRAWRDINELDLATGRQRIVVKGGRIGDLAVNPADHGLWGVRHNNGRSALVRITPATGDYDEVLAFAYGRDLIDLDISPDGTLLTGAMIEVNGAQKLVAFRIKDLLAGKGDFETLHQFDNNSPSNFVFTPDGRYLLGSSYYSGVSNVFRYDRETKKMEALTNADTGYFRPMAGPSGDILAYRYRAKGFQPVRFAATVREDVNAVHYLGQEVVDRHPVVKTWNAGSPLRVDLDKVTTYLGPYKPGAVFRLANLYPVLEGYKNSVAAGFRFNFSDLLGRHSADLTLAYSPDSKLQGSERFHAKAGYEFQSWKIRAAHNGTDFYDLFGPTKVGRKGDALSVSYKDFLLFERPRVMSYTVTGAYYGNLDTVPEFQNVSSPYREYATFGVRLDYQDLRRTVGAIEDERGVKWSLSGFASRVNGDVFPRFQGTFDIGGVLPLEHSSLWLRTAAGKSTGDRANPFSQFFFGGFGNNYVDYQEVKRFRDSASLPGLEINEIGGNDFGRVMLEWALPPMHFRKLGFYGLYANWARVALFTSYLGTDLTQRDYRRNLRNAGLQLDLSLTLFSDLESTLSLGYAVARENGRNHTELMASLKVLR
ncbi:MAG: hypothetical protein IPL96_11265 [Holophagaceae bacterium]|nr:hypothetical protein [Holophagaceae bacterium]